MYRDDPLPGDAASYDGKPPENGPQAPDNNPPTPDSNTPEPKDGK